MSASASPRFECLLTERRGRVLIVTLNRPQALNALNDAMMAELARVAQDFETDDTARVLVLTGGERAFAAGADIKEMAEKTFAQNYTGNFISSHWERLAQVRKPVIAAVAGYALGGGFELALMADFIIAADSAKFGLPEITLGTLPGIGGTQRLTRLVGQAKAMEMVLTGRRIEASEAERLGIAARVVPADDLMTESLKTAETISGFSLPALLMAKEAVKAAQETHLPEGIRLERRLFQASFATDDQKEGMRAFIEKRKPVFGDK